MSAPTPYSAPLPHALADLSQDTAGMWWWACACGVTCDDAVLTAMLAANDYLGHLAETANGNAPHEHEWVGERNVKDAPNATMQMRCSICDVPAPSAPQEPSS